MNSIPIFIFLFFSYIQNIKSHNVACSSSYIVTPYSAYHCAGLNINIEGDTHCCFWNLTDSNNIVLFSTSGSNFANDLFISGKLTFTPK